MKGIKYRYPDLASLLIVCLAIFTLFGCNRRLNTVVAATGTNIGVEISQNPATQVPQAKLGYQRGELAIVPSNRAANETEEAQERGDAREVPDVVMEIKYVGIFDTGQASGIYQRLAVGHTAVQQPGAAFMFARDAKGDVTPEVAEDVAKALQNTPSASPLEALDAFEPIHKAYVDLTQTEGADADKTHYKQFFDAAAREVKQDNSYTFQKFIVGKESIEDIKKIRSELEKDPVVKAKIKAHES